MRKYLILFVVILNILVLVIVISSNSFQGNVAAAPLSEAELSSAQQITGDTIRYKSVSLYEFVPLNPNNTLHTVNVNRRLLTLGAKSDYNFGGANMFHAPLNLPDNAMVTGMTIFGVDNDNQGEVKVTLFSCNHNLLTLCQEIPLSSTLPKSDGIFETPSVISPLLIRHQDNFYYLQLEITALNSSGLRSVAIQFVDNGGPVPTPTNLTENPVVRWNLDANQSLEIPNPTGNPITVRVCVDTLAGEFYERPDVITDGGEITTLPFGGHCQDFNGSSIQIKGKGRTTTSGRYQRLQ